MRPTNILILAGLLGCGGGTTTPQCDDCGAPSECAEPFCGADGSCDPGYLTQSLDDDTAGDCLAPTCDGTGAEAVYVDDPADLPLTEPEAVCTVAACTESGPELLPAELGTACGESFCDGEALGDDACRMRCADTEPDPLATDAGCTRERPYCVVGIEGFTNAGCIAPTVWDEEWGTATIGIDGVAVANLGSDTNVRTVQRFSTGTYYWEIEVLLGDPEINDGGVGILNSEMPEDDAYIGATSTGLSFGYPPYTQYWTGWRNVVVAGDPPEASFVSKGIIYMFALDADAGELWVGSEGVWYHGGDPAKGLNPAATGIPVPVHAGVTLYDEHTNVFEANFMGPFQFPVPDGFRPGLF